MKRVIPGGLIRGLPYETRGYSPKPVAPRPSLDTPHFDVGAGYTPKVPESNRQAAPSAPPPPSKND
jgi:hypothetical protein